MVETKTERVIRCVKELIEDQDLSPGDLLPTYEELGRLCRVSDSTVARAVMVLQATNTVYGEPGRRLFVGPRSAPSEGT